MTDGKKETEAEREEPHSVKKAEVKRQANGGSEAEQSSQSTARIGFNQSIQSIKRSKHHHLTSASALFDSSSIRSK